MAAFRTSELSVKSVKNLKLTLCFDHCLWIGRHLADIPHQFGDLREMCRLQLPVGFAPLTVLFLIGSILKLFRHI